MRILSRKNINEKLVSHQSREKNSTKDHVCMRGMRTSWIKDEKSPRLDVSDERENCLSIHVMTNNAHQGSLWPFKVCTMLLLP